MRGITARRFLRIKTCVRRETHVKTVSKCMREAPPRPGRSFFAREEARVQERLRRPEWGPMGPRRCRGLHGASYFTYRNVCAVKKTRKNACGRPKSYARHNGPSFFTIEKRSLFFFRVFSPLEPPFSRVKNGVWWLSRLWRLVFYVCFF